MPMRALRPCTMPGCPSLVTVGRCAQHAIAERPRGRLLASLRAAFQGVPCAACGSRSSPWFLDHRVPLFKGGQDVSSNRQRLCKPCHDAKTARER